MSAAILLGVLQLLVATRVVARFLRTAGGSRVRPEPLAQRARVAVVVPVLDEHARLGPCLEGLRAQGHEVVQILVVDGGSRDGTQDLVAAAAASEPRLRLVTANPLPAGWTGKAWGLAVGLANVAPDVDWVLCLDADVRPTPALARSLVAHAERERVGALSVATRQTVRGAALGLLHPSLLATLVYRYGLPGRATRDVARAVANGQCFLARCEVLRLTGAVDAARGSLCEDVTIARHLAAAGERVGFYEAGDLVTVEMYARAADAWAGWPRSLALRDAYAGWHGAVGLAELTLVQALPLPLSILLVATDGSVVLAALQVGLLAVRGGVLAGMARAYVARPWTYWLSPLADAPVVARIVVCALRRRHRWRGHLYVRGPRGQFRLEGETR